MPWQHFTEPLDGSRSIRFAERHELWEKLAAKLEIPGSYLWVDLEATEVLGASRYRQDLGVWYEGEVQRTGTLARLLFDSLSILQDPLRNYFVEAAAQFSIDEAGLLELFDNGDRVTWYDHSAIWNIYRSVIDSAAALPLVQYRKTQFGDEKKGFNAFDRSSGARYVFAYDALAGKYSAYLPPEGTHKGDLTDPLSAVPPSESATATEIRDFFGTLMYRASEEFTNAQFVESILGRQPAWPGTWTQTNPRLHANYLPDPTVYVFDESFSGIVWNTFCTRERLQYKFLIPSGSSDTYRLRWVELFQPAAGGDPIERDMLYEWDGTSTETPIYTAIPDVAGELTLVELHADTGGTAPTPKKPTNMRATTSLSGKVVVTGRAQ